jgi:hypothetical protein
MRRLISISTAVALLISLVSPLLAEACVKNGGRASCHRVGQAAPHHHNCDGMPGHHHEDDMSAPDQSDSISSLDSTCPMNCCLATQAGKHVAVVNNIAIAPQLAVSAKSQLAAVVFIATGFSSHTDRGPPAVS